MTAVIIVCGVLGGVIVVMLTQVVFDEIHRRRLLKKLKKSKTKFGRYLERRLALGWSLSQARRLHSWYAKRGYRLTSQDV